MEMIKSLLSFPNVNYKSMQTIFLRIQTIFKQTKSSRNFAKIENATHTWDHIIKDLERIHMVDTIFI